jgi:hypothetical protein
MSATSSRCRRGLDFGEYRRRRAYEEEYVQSAVRRVVIHLGAICNTRRHFQPANAPADEHVPQSSLLVRTGQEFSCLRLKYGHELVGMNVTFVLSPLLW